MSPSTGQTSSSVYQTCDPAYLRQLREAAGMDTQVLAKIACMSLGQVRELEQGTQTGVFYSESIRRQAYKRLLLILGAEPPRAELVEVPEPAKPEHQAQLQSLDQIVAMSRLPAMEPSLWTPLLTLAQRVVQYKQTVAAGGLLVLAAVLLVLNWPTAGLRSVLPVASQVASDTSPVASEPVMVVTPKPEQVVHEPVASAPVVAAAASVAAPVAPVAAPAAVTSCAFSAEAWPQVVPMVATKPAGYVYLVGTGNVELCVVDGAKQATVLTLKNGEGRSVYGTPPWQVSGAQLNKVQVFFQGWRVTLPSENAQHMALVEKKNSP